MGYSLIEAKARVDGTSVPAGEPIDLVYNYNWDAEIAASDYFPQPQEGTPLTMDNPSTWLAPEITDFQNGEITQEYIQQLRPKKPDGTPVTSFAELQTFLQTDYAQRRAIALKQNQDAFRNLRLAGWSGSAWSFIDG